MGICLALLLNEQLWFKRMIRGAVLLPWVIPTALVDARLVVDVQLALQRGELDGHRASGSWIRRARTGSARGTTPWRRSSSSTSGAACRSSPSPSWPGSSPSRRSSTRRPRPTAPAPMPRFWHITLPLLKPVLAIVVLFSTIFTFSDFNIVYVLTHGGPINSTHLFATLSRHDRDRHRADRRGRGHLALPLPAARLRGLGAAPLRAEADLLMAVARRPFAGEGRAAPAPLPFLVFALFPFYHMTLTSLKQDRELYDRYAVPLIIRRAPTLEHYTKLLWDTEFLTWTKNSLLVTILATVVSVAIGHGRGLRARPAEVRRRRPPSAPASSSPTSCRRRSSSCRWPRS